MNLTDYQKDILNAKICPYCKSCTVIKTETDIYGKEYRNRPVISCFNYPNCDSYVGCHKDGKPLGRLANKTLRMDKKEAHFHFDKLWSENLLNRSECYGLLSEHLQLPQDYTHIGMMSENTCKKVSEWSKHTYLNLVKIENNNKHAVK